MPFDTKATTIRIVWLVGVAVMVGIFAAGLPASLTIARTLSPATEAQLARLGLPQGAPAAYLLVIDTVAMLFFASVATLLLWQRPNQRMARIAALTLLLTAALYTAPIYESPLPIWAKALISAGAEVAQVAFIFSFPNGRFVPRWVVWGLIPLAAWRFAVWYAVYLPNLFALERTGERYPFLPQDPRDLALFLAILIAGVGVQIYRYRRIDTPLERQQVKWLLWGMVGTVAIVGGYVLLLNLFGNVIPAQHDLLLRLSARTLRHTALALVPISLIYAVLHYRLWEIDTLINRALAYGVITGLLAAVFGSAIVLLQLLITPRAESDMTGPAAIDPGYTAIVALSTLITVLLARPLYRRVQASIDRRFNRRTWHAQQAIADMRRRLRDEVAIDQLAAQVLAVAQKTWQPESLSLWIPAAPGMERRPSVRYTAGSAPQGASRGSE